MKRKYQSIEDKNLQTDRTNSLRMVWPTICSFLPGCLSMFFTLQSLSKEFKTLALTLLFNVDADSKQWHFWKDKLKYIRFLTVENNMELINSCLNLEHLTLRVSRFEDILITSNILKSLAIRGSKKGEVGLHLRTVNLTNLKISNCNFSFASVDLPKLKKLMVVGCNQYQTILKEATSLRECYLAGHGIEDCTLIPTTVTNLTLQSFRHSTPISILHLKQLEKLSLGWMTLATVLPSLPSTLKRVKLSYLQDLSDVSELNHLKSLEKVKICGCSKVIRSHELVWQQSQK